MAKFVKVKLPVDRPDETLHLCDRIIAKHTLDGAGSALAGVIDMTAFGLLVTDAKTKRSNAELKEGEANDKYDAANNKAGLAAGQNRDTKDTIQWYVRQAKDILLVKHNGTEEALNPYGFTVIISTTGARKNIKIELPVNLLPMLEMGEAIVAHHTLLGAGSPLTAALIDMAAFGTLVTDTRTLYDAWELLRDDIQTLNNDSLTTLGYAPGQTISTIGTIYNELGKIRTRLLQNHQGREEALSNWGFNVIMKDSKKKAGKPSISGTVTDTLGNPISGALVLVIEPDIFVATGADGKFQVPQLTPDTYSLLVHKSGFADKQVSGIVVTAGATTTANVVLASASTFGTVSGQITQGGSGAPGTVTIQVAGSPQVISTDGAGNYIIPNVPPGNYALQGALDSNPGNTITHNITVVAGETTTVNFVFP